MPVEFDQDQVLTDPLADLGPVEDPKPEVKTDSQTVTSPDVTQRLQDIQTAVKGNDLLTKILANPAVQEVLRAQQNGIPIQVVAQSQTKVETPAEPDWEKFKDDPKAMSEYMIKSIVSQLTPGVEDALSKRTQPLIDKLSQIEKSVSEQVTESATSKFQKFKADHPDSEKFIPKMRDLNTQTGGTLEYEDLYQLAKLKSGVPLVGQKEVETERPTDSVARQPMQPSKLKIYPQGRRGMRQAMNDVLDKAGLEDIFVG